MRAFGRARRPSGRRPAAATAPYPGLASFQDEDAPRFFGRARVTGRLAGPASAASGAPLILVGPSGSGKSSLLRAGFVPRIASRPHLLLTPADTPLADLEAQLAALGGVDRPGGPAVIIIDQFEATFTGARYEEERRAYIDRLGTLARSAVVVLALRADFYDRALRYPRLARALQDRQVVLGPMSRDEVRAAIVEPARLERMEVEDGLVEVLLRDLAPGGDGPQDAGAHEAGALPLLSHALLATWQRSHGSRLTLADYQASGGIQNAIRQSADAAYDALPADRRDLARRLFLRLVTVADETPAVRRVVPLAELGRPGDDVLGEFVGHRLITVDARRAARTRPCGCGTSAARPIPGPWADR